MNNFLYKFCLIASALIISVSFAAAQGPVKAPVGPRPGRPAGHPPEVPDAIVHDYERSMKVAPSLNLQLCVREGDVKVNGWNRDELRVLVQDGSKFGFNVMQTDPKTQAAAWVSVSGIVGRERSPVTTDCISGGEIEIDMPVHATLTFKGQETTTAVDSLRKVKVQTSGGDIALRNISEGVWASTYEGNLTVENSVGQMSLDATNGNIVVFEGSPKEIGDTFSAKTTGGTISLQNLSYRQIEANSISGTVVFSGEVLNGGNYNLTTSKGSIRLALPQNTACSVAATYGFGTFNSELPFKLETENISETLKSVVGKLGGGGTAMLRLTTNNGTIGIRKL
jgi:hypothetical protein